MSIRRIGFSLEQPVSTVGRWLGPVNSAASKARECPVSGDPAFRAKVKELCEEDRHEKYGHRRIRAHLARRFGIRATRKTVLRVMREEDLSQPRIRFKASRSKRMKKMRPPAPNRGWQIDMTSFSLSNFTPLFLIVVMDCFSRKIVGWSLDRRCRASEWISAVRSGLDRQGLVTREACRDLILRSDNGSQPCSKRFVEYLASTGVQGEYTGYNAPDDNAFVERVIRTIKEEEIWLNEYDCWSEAHEAIEKYVEFYNAERIHSALDYRTPAEMEAAHCTRKAA